LIINALFNALYFRNERAEQLCYKQRSQMMKVKIFVEFEELPVG